MQYGLHELIGNVFSLIKTKLFYPQARLIRYPFYLRNKKYVSISSGFTTGYRCRIEAIEKDGKHGNISFGENVKMGDYVHISSYENISIGNNVLMASHIFITDIEHGCYSGENQSTPDSLVDQRELSAKSVHIGNNVWIGEGVKILKGVTIGDNSIIGANSLVTKDIPSDSIAVGSIARVIKKYDYESKTWRRVD